MEMGNCAAELNQSVWFWVSVYGIAGLCGVVLVSLRLLWAPGALCTLGEGRVVGIKTWMLLAAVVPSLVFYFCCRPVDVNQVEEFGRPTPGEILRNAILTCLVLITFMMVVSHQIPAPSCEALVKMSSLERTALQGIGATKFAKAKSAGVLSEKEILMMAPTRSTDAVTNGKKKGGNDVAGAI